MNRTELLGTVEKYLDETTKEKKFTPRVSEVPVSGSRITTEDKLHLIDTVLDGWYTEHDISIRFARELAKYIGVGYGSLCNSGSSADLLAISAVKHIYKSGHKVITTATCFPTTVTPIVQNFYQPLFIDTDPYTLQPDLDKVDELLGKNDVAGVVLTHMLGFPFDAARVQKSCQRCNKFFIEDSCDALGAKVGDKRTGSFGIFSTLSMFPAHHITMGEGGAVFSDNKEAIDLIENYKNWGRDCYCLPGQQNTCGHRFDNIWAKLPLGYDHKYTFTKLGYNLKTTELQAALGLSQFHRIDKIVSKRQQNYAYLLLRIEHSEYIHCVEAEEFASPSPFGLPILVKQNAPFTRNELTQYLEDHKIRTRTVFAGNITRQPVMEQVYYEIAQPLAGSDAIMDRMFWIGCHPELSQVQLDYVISVFDDFFNERKLK